MKDILGKIIWSILWICVFCILIPFLILCFREIERQKNYYREHPCIKKEIQEDCHEYEICTGGIMLPGFCTTEKRVTCQTKEVCIERR